MQVQKVYAVIAKCLILAAFAKGIPAVAEVVESSARSVIPNLYFGGTGCDSLSATGGSSITMVGGSGNSTLIAPPGPGPTLTNTGGSSITM